MLGQHGLAIPTSSNAVCLYTLERLAIFKVDTWLTSLNPDGFHFLTQATCDAIKSLVSRICRLDHALVPNLGVDGFRFCCRNMFPRIGAGWNKS